MANAAQPAELVWTLCAPALVQLRPETLTVVRVKSFNGAAVHYGG